MTRVGGSTEIIKRHHLLTPIEHGVLGDLEDLVAMAQSATGSRFDDAARIVPDDENIHVVWEEVVNPDYESDLDNYLSYAGIDLDHEIMIKLLESVKKWRARGK